MIPTPTPLADYAAQYVELGSGAWVFTAILAALIAGCLLGSLAAAMRSAGDAGEGSIDSES